MLRGNIWKALFYYTLLTLCFIRSLGVKTCTWDVREKIGIVWKILLVKRCHWLTFPELRKTLAKELVIKRLTDITAKFLSVHLLLDSLKRQIRFNWILNFTGCLFLIGDCSLKMCFCKCFKGKLIFFRLDLKISVVKNVISFIRSKQFVVSNEFPRKERIRK